MNQPVMKPVYLLRDDLVTSLGFGTPAHYTALLEGLSGIREVDDPLLYPKPMQLSRVDTAELESRFQTLLAVRGKDVPPTAFTRLEKMILLSVHETLRDFPQLAADPRTLLVISTTKGNIDLLEDRYKLVFSHKRLFLWEMGRVVAQFFGFVNPPLIISNACISGLVAILAATRYLQSGTYDHAVVTGGDIASEFVISGFQSFQELSPDPCKPFDLNRKGLSLGEGCGTLLLGTDAAMVTGPAITVAGGATSNDANHISGPSRTGEELGWAILNALKQAGMTPGGIGYISAHGTATPFNDEMESKAFECAGVAGVPVNSFKGYWGHTLGAAGLIESIMAAASLRTDTLFRSAGYEQSGVPVPLDVITKTRTQPLSACLKTASGFGGCNAAVIYRKH